MDGKRWAAYYVLWAICLSFLIGCNAEVNLTEFLKDIDLWDDLIDLLDQLIDLIYQVTDAG